MVQVGAEHGVSRQALLHRTGVSAVDLEDESTGIAADQEIAVTRNLLRHTGSPHALAIEVGRRYTLGNTGILGFALLTSPTTRAAIGTALTYVGLTSTLLRYRLEEDGDKASLVMDADEIPEDVRTFVLARDLTALFNSIFPATFGPLFDGRLDLALDRGDLKGFLEVLPPLVGVRTGATRNAFVFPRARLDEPMPQADPYTARLCAVQCEELLQRRRQRAGTAHRVRVRLLCDPAAMPSAEQIADELGVDVRTLRRHLVAEGTSFLRDEVREQLAVELLGDLGLSVTEVARRLGYAETSAFSHAFKRWRGVSPRTFQQQRAA